MGKVSHFIFPSSVWYQLFYSNQFATVAWWLATSCGTQSVLHKNGGKTKNTHNYWGHLVKETSGYFRHSAVAFERIACYVFCDHNRASWVICEKISDNHLPLMLFVKFDCVWSSCIRVVCTCWQSKDKDPYGSTCIEHILFI